MANHADITPELCRQLLRYDPETGGLFWRERPRTLCDSDRIWRSWNTKFAGKPAMNSLRQLTGYTCYIGAIMNVKYKTHRVAWAIYYGEWPEEVDHINGNALDNRIVNLRSVSHQENCRNRRMPSNNKSGVFGVYWAERHGRWLAKIKIPQTRRYKHIGLFESLEEAGRAVEDAKRLYGYHENHGRAP